MVVLTGLDDDRVGRAAVAAGAQDYLVKGKVDAELLSRAARYAVERKQIQRSVARERQILELMARDMPLEPILEHITVGLESETSGGRCELVLVVRTDGSVAINRIVAPSLSARYLDGLDRLARSGAATPHAAVLAQAAILVAVAIKRANAAHRGGFDAWPQWQELARAECLPTLWMVPVMSEGKALGTLALYPPEPRHPTMAEVEVLQASANLAALAVERYKSQQVLADQALHDELTGLPNRFLLVDRLDLALREAARHRTDTAVLFLDLDHFKLVNDGLGHSVGDQVLPRGGTSSGGHGPLGGHPGSLRRRRVRRDLPRPARCPPCHPGRAPAARRPGAAVQPRRDDPVGVRQCRSRHVVGGRAQRRGAPPRCRRGHVPGQGTRPEPARDFRRAHA